MHALKETFRGGPLQAAHRFHDVDIYVDERSHGPTWSHGPRGFSSKDLSRNRTCAATRPACCPQVWSGLELAHSRIHKLTAKSASVAKRSARSFMMPVLLVFQRPFRALYTMRKGTRKRAWLIKLVITLHLISTTCFPVLTQRTRNSYGDVTLTSKSCHEGKCRNDSFFAEFLTPI